ncbi:hypothetical protein LOTGIDRAFT_232755 [Lottia gigantea]|uniref:Uncharacterized protein n=1 Tax=Lottia gigantea TaxID=225164 RepID=V4BWI2_LOTGI|nr:hypothetical protein LOTGIDRAFT_232755 [Lottia gigantea]ESO93344.1 hypothetical protein LOTGIDRAFT_232755 [Lottia gigantea]
MNEKRREKRARNKAGKREIGEKGEKKGEERGEKVRVKRGESEENCPRFLAYFLAFSPFPPFLAFFLRFSPFSSHFLASFLAGREIEKKGEKGEEKGKEKSEEKGEEKGEKDRKRARKKARKRARKKGRKKARKQGQDVYVVMDFKSSSEKINSAIATLKHELTLMRDQDLQLLKQLIHIHETIRKLSKTRGGTPRRPVSCSSRGLNLSNGYMNGRRPPLVRQQSEPYFCAETGYYRGVSTSSTDEYFDFPDDGLSSESEFDDSISSIKSLKHVERLRTRSVSLIATVPLNCDELSSNACYSDILEKNIKLWKLSQSLDKDSVFDDDTFIIAESDEDR